MGIRYLLIIQFLFMAFVARAQGVQKIDSLMNEIKTAEKDTNIVKLYLELGSLYERSMPESSVAYFNKALNLAQVTGSKKLIAKTQNKVGNGFLDKGNYDKAIDCYLQSVILYEELGDKIGISKCYNNIGIVYLYQSSYDKTIEYFNKSLKIAEELKDKNLIATAYNNIGMVYSEQNKFDLSLDYYSRSLNIYEELGDKKGMSACFTNIGIDYKMQGIYDKAISYYKKSLKIKNELGDKKGLTIVYINMAELNIGLKIYAEAINYAIQGLNIAQEINALALQKDAYKILFTANDSLHNYSDAYKFHVLFKQINDSIYNENSSKKINEMLTKYGTEKKEKENELLIKDNEIKILALEKQTTLRNFFVMLSAFVILLVVFAFYRLHLKRKANRVLTEKNELITTQKKELSDALVKLNESNSTKDKFFSIIGHDLRSPVQAIIGFSELLKYDTSELYTDKMRAKVDHIYHAGKNTSNLLSNLLDWARTQTGTIEFKPEKFNLKSVVDNEVDFLSIIASKKQIEISTDIKDGMEVFADKNMLSTVIRNLISNAIKFTYENGKIQINCRQTGGYIETTVSDNGVGIDPKIINNIFKIDFTSSTKGTNNEIGTGLGLTLCKEFIERNNGIIRVESTPGKGSNFIFTFPSAD